MENVWRKYKDCDVVQSQSNGVSRDLEYVVYRNSQQFAEIWYDAWRDKWNIRCRWLSDAYMVRERNSLEHVLKSLDEAIRDAGTREWHVETAQQQVEMLMRHE